jgi:hypothetical protein
MVRTGFGQDTAHKLGKNSGFCIEGAGELGASSERIARSVPLKNAAYRSADGRNHNDFSHSLILTRRGA